MPDQYIDRRDSLARIDAAVAEILLGLKNDTQRAYVYDTLGKMIRAKIYKGAPPPYIKGTLLGGIYYALTEKVLPVFAEADLQAYIAKGNNPTPWVNAEYMVRTYLGDIAIRFEWKARDAKTVLALKKAKPKGQPMTVASLGSTYLPGTLTVSAGPKTTLEYTKGNWILVHH